ncbi:MAG: uroporphyrinogen decarboxylase family protein [Promethearchaeota archaeon]
MNVRERILKTINHEEPDKVPSFELSIDNLSICKHFGEEYVFQGIGKSFSDAYELFKGDTEQLTQTILMASETRRALKNSPHLELYKKIGIDIATVPLTGYVVFPIKCGKTHFVDEYGRIFDLNKNPKDDMDIAYYRAGAFNSFEEYESAPPLDPDNPRREKYFKAMKKSEKDSEGKLYVMPSAWGVFEPTWQAFGFANFSRLLANSAQIKKVFDNNGKFLVEVLKRFIEWGEDTLFYIYADYGYKSGLLMSPNNYRKYVLPWIKETCKIAHKGGVKVILHSCGDILPLFEDIINIGIDAIHPIEPTTANPDYNIFKLYEKYRDKITFIGNVSPQDLAEKTPEFIQDYTKKLIKELAPGGGYMLSSGHSINPAVKLENFLAMHKTLEKYGKYPINIDK